MRSIIFRHLFGSQAKSKRLGTAGLANGGNRSIGYANTGKGMVKNEIRKNEQDDDKREHTNAYEHN